jgi:GTPase Era involved in 16S rRNA processing
MNRFTLVLLTSFFLFVGFGRAQTPANQNTIYLRCGSLIDGKSDGARKNVIVAVEGDQIKQVGAAQRRAMSSIFRARLAFRV